jgi:hypothetical protein
MKAGQKVPSNPSGSDRISVRIKVEDYPGMFLEEVCTWKKSFFALLT